ncbi:hypothetical protein CYQ88_09915 [Hydrogenovibrio sp. SC-1]|uniref:hypothetical protein n=1 Tax=Hydrogenovibrio sp. SC-1 TaxID=2065820 RepID=UPI000C7D3400|nr:hypothetical protein [Hydrogenovibrio sp. SC-1]PLA73682.1 hypothetical protein CYQ88_09840 [Hydrogenovibrio sp. SC-1]PLA73697.1 hypothetical protein CYQ88_09915 [Hydrogenovibrio sp. SC-1]
MASKIDTLRLSLVKQDALVLSDMYGKDPFAHIPKLEPSSALQLQAFITPPVDFEKATSKSRNKPHYLLFIVDVLKRIQLMGSAILDRTQFKINNQISDNFQSIISLSETCLNHFEALVDDFPSLSVDSFIAELTAKVGYLEKQDIAQQITRAMDGIINENPLYDSLFEPFIFHPTETELEFLSNHAFICAALWNAHFIIPHKLHAKHSMSRELRRISTTQALWHSDFGGYETYEELIQDIEQYGEFSKIVFYLNKLYKDDNPRAKKSKGGSGSNTPRPRIRFIKASDNITTNDLSIDGTNIQLVRTIGERSSTDTESALDLAEDELTDDEYFQESDDSPTYSIERKNLTSRQAISHIEKANQFLRDQLTNQEFESILDSLEKYAHAITSKRNPLYASSAVIQIALSLCTGNSLNKRYRIRLTAEEDKLIQKVINLKADCTQVYLPLTYKYLSGIEENHGQNYRTDKFICYNLPNRVQTILKAAVKVWTDAKANLETNEGSLTEYSIYTNNQTLKRLFESFKLDQRLTPEFVQQAIQSTFFNASNGDFWSVSILSGTPKVIGATQLHYTTLANLKLFEDYQKGIYALFREKVELPKKSSPNLFIGYGNPIRPIKSIVQKELTHISSFVSTKLDRDPMSLATHELIDLVNLIMLFAETYSSYFTAIRNVTNPYIGLQSIDHEGFTIITDKVIQGGYNTRIIPILEPIQDMLDYFEHYTVRLIDIFRRKKLAKWSDFFASNLEPEFKWRGLVSPNKAFPGYFLISTELIQKKGMHSRLKLIPYTRLSALKLYEASGHLNNPLFLKLAPNANRHFLRSALLERGANPEYIDEFMGHRHFGTESWNLVALFNQQDYRKAIKAELQKIYADFKVPLPFKPISNQVNDTLNSNYPIK